MTLKLFTIRLTLALGVLFGGISGAALAVEPSEVLEDANLEARARTLSKELRCLVCQNENIDSSHAPLAKDLRILLRERLVAGDTDEEVLAFLVARYGDFVLLKPPVQGNTLVLWLAPALFMIFAALGVLFYARGTGAAKRDTELSDADAKRLARLLDED